MISKLILEVLCSLIHDAWPELLLQGCEMLTSLFDKLISNKSPDDLLNFDSPLDPHLGCAFALIDPRIGTRIASRFDPQWAWHGDPHMDARCDPRASSLFRSGSPNLANFGSPVQSPDFLQIDHQTGSHEIYKSIPICVIGARPATTSGSSRHRPTDRIRGRIGCQIN